MAKITFLEIWMERAPDQLGPFIYLGPLLPVWKHVAMTTSTCTGQLITSLGRAI